MPSVFGFVSFEVEDDEGFNEFGKFLEMLENTPLYADLSPNMTRALDNNNRNLTT
jgi:hypothetical protein